MANCCEFLAVSEFSFTSIHLQVDKVKLPVGNFSDSGQRCVVLKDAKYIYINKYDQRDLWILGNFTAIQTRNLSRYISYLRVGVRV